MKKLFTAIVLPVAILMASCSGAEAGSAADVPADKTAKTKTANPGKMNDFMAMLDGTDGSAKKAADAYFSEDLKSSLADSDKLTFVDFTMKAAKVVSVEGSCCTMEAQAGVTTRSFRLCWQDDKITSIEDLGIK